MSVVFGELASEKIAEENELCRKIVSEISQYGVSDRQRLFIVYLLSLELEDTELMQILTQTIRQAGTKSFILEP
jgi:glutathionylspermidine synthase